MKQYVFNFQSLNDYRKKLKDIENEINFYSKSVLVQVYSGVVDDKEALSIARFTQDTLRNSHVVACSSSGEIGEGLLQERGSVASITRFDSSEVDVHFAEISPGRETETGDKFGQIISSDKDEIKCVLFFITPRQIQSHQFIRSMGKYLTDVTFVGAGTDKEDSSFLLYNDKLSKSASVAIVLKGNDLHASMNTILGWKPIGRHISITSARNNRVYEIDEEPAELVYEHYIGSDKNSLLSDTQVFPLIFERDGHEIARVSNEIHHDGSISFLADVYEGEQFRLGYGDIYTMEQEIGMAIEQLNKFEPDSIYLFPCISRKTFLEEDIDHELKPFEKLAPTVGFLSQCEVSSDCGTTNTLNAAYLTLGLKESSSVDSIKKRNAVKFQLSRNASRTAKLMYFMSQITDELEKANQELEKHSRIDFLTGALNRKAFDAHLEYELSKSNRYESSASLVMMDIDFFKKINDNYGHLIGDEMLIVVSQLVNSQIRESDVFARYGGEEFILFLPETSILDAKGMAERIRAEIEQGTLHSTSGKPAITCSFGVSAQNSSDDMLTLIKRADDALYQAKNNGRNRVEIDP